MALRNIVFEDNERIRKVSKVVTTFDEQLWQLLDDMKQTMDHHNGIGLACPQIGVLKRVVIVNVNNMFLELINPEIVTTKGQCEEIEGCLSVRGYNAYVIRPKSTTVRAFDRYGYQFTITGENLLSACLCHEIDHLDGILFTDKVSKEIVKKSKTKK